MHQYIPSNPNFDKKISSDQLSQIVEAILDGKYSWACVLLLRFTGENPLHYIPYRTYNRLVKENNPVSRRRGQETSNTNIINQSSQTRINNVPVQKSLSEIADLAYLEVVDEQHAQARGGNLEQQWGRKILEYSSLKAELVQQKIKHFLFSTGKKSIN